MRLNLTGKKISTYLIAIYFLFIPFDFIQIFPSISLAKVIAVLPILAVILEYKRIRLRFDYFFMLSITYITVHMLSIMYSISLDSSISVLISITTNIVLILFMSAIPNTTFDMKILANSILYSSWLVLIATIVLSFGNIQQGRLTLSMFGSNQDPNYLVGYIIYPILYYLYEYFKSKRFINILIMAIFIAFVLFTGSRGGLLAVITATVTLLILYAIQSKNSAKWWKYFFVSTVSIVVLIYISTQLLPIDIRNRFSINEIIVGNGTGRYDIWQDLLRSYKDFSVFSKLFGVGAGTSYLYTGGLYAHNVWLETLIGVGLIGVVFLIIYYVYLITLSYKHKNIVLTATILGYLVMGLSLSLIAYKPLWSIIFLVISYAKTLKSKIRLQ